MVISTAYADRCNYLEVKAFVKYEHGSIEHIMETSKPSVTVNVEIFDPQTGTMVTQSLTFDGDIPSINDIHHDSQDGIVLPLEKLGTGLLDTAYQAVCKAQEVYYAESAKKKLTDPEQRVYYREVETMAGRMKVAVTGDYGASLNSHERIVVPEVIERMVQFVDDSSYTRTTDCLNKALRRKHGDLFAVKTVQELLARLGKKVDTCIEAMTCSILDTNGFDSETLLPKDIDALSSDITTGNKEHPSVDDKYIGIRMEMYNAGKCDDFVLSKEELAAHLDHTESKRLVIGVGLDDICENGQKKERDKKGKNGVGTPKSVNNSTPNQGASDLSASYPEYCESEKAADLEEAAKESDQADAEQEKASTGKGQKKAKSKKSKKEKKRKTPRVWNTIGVVLIGNKIYRFRARGKKNAIKQILAFLLNGGFLKNADLVFFTDGAQDIKDAIATYFGFRPYYIVLDWLHVKKKTSEYISMAFGGKIAEKAAIKEELYRYLWLGKVDSAINYLKSIDESRRKDPSYFEKLIGYLERKKPYIPCYELRRWLGLKNSSQFVEKTNDLIVASRQKNNGMSWSWNGSGALANLKTLVLNGELGRFLREHRLAFEPVDPHRSREEQDSLGMAA